VGWRSHFYPTIFIDLVVPDKTQGWGVDWAIALASAAEDNTSLEHPIKSSKIKKILDLVLTNAENC
jgi:hypothetical protein